MSEELNDNLPVNENAVDGIENLETQETISTESQEVENVTLTDETTEEIAEVAEPDTEISTEEVIEVATDATPIEVATDESEVAMNAIADANAEESGQGSSIASNAAVRWPWQGRDQRCPQAGQLRGIKGSVG